MCLIWSFSCYSFLFWFAIISGFMLTLSQIGCHWLLAYGLFVLTGLVGIGLLFVLAIAGAAALGAA
jgi:hypothetical protein